MYYHDIYIYTSFTYNIYIYTLTHCLYIDFIIKAFLWICCLFSRSSGFRICQSSSSKTEKLSCISRASCAQAPRKQKNAFGWSKEGDPTTDDVMSRSSRSTSSSDSSDWKKSAQVHCCRKIEALVFLLANSMIVRQGMFFNYEKRRHARKCVIWPILGTSFSTNRHIVEMKGKGKENGPLSLITLRGQSPLCATPQLMTCFTSTNCIIFAYFCRETYIYYNYIYIYIC